MIYHCENSDQVLRNVHEEVDCHGPCPIHRRSKHHMRSFPQHWRHDRQIMERTCSHGVGHPDPDDPTLDTVHGCCWEQCCTPPEDRRAFP